MPVDAALRSALIKWMAHLFPPWESPSALHVPARPRHSSFNYCIAFLAINRTTARAAPITQKFVSFALPSIILLCGRAKSLPCVMPLSLNQSTHRASNHTASSLFLSSL